MLPEIIIRGGAACQALFMAGVALLPTSPENIANHHLAVETLLSPPVQQSQIFQGPRLDDLPEKHPIDNFIHWTNRLYPPQVITRGCPDCRTIRKLDIFRGKIRDTQQSCVLGVDYFRPDLSRSILLVLAPIRSNQQLTYIDEAESYRSRIAVGIDYMMSFRFHQISWMPLLPELKSTLIELTPTHMSVRSLPALSPEAADQASFHTIQISFDPNGRVSVAAGQVMGRDQALVCDFREIWPP